jgi:hypothetical protein
MQGNQGMSSVQWTSCPQCGLVAEVVDRDVWPSTDGPVEHLHVRCVDRHRFVLPASSLELHHDDESTRAAQRAGRELVRHEPPQRDLAPVRARTPRRHDG